MFSIIKEGVWSYCNCMLHTEILDRPNGFWKADVEVVVDEYEV